MTLLLRLHQQGAKWPFRKLIWRKTGAKTCTKPINMCTWANTGTAVSSDCPPTPRSVHTASHSYVSESICVGRYYFSSGSFPPDGFYSSGEVWRDGFTPTDDVEASSDQLWCNKARCFRTEEQTTTVRQTEQIVATRRAKRWPKSSSLLNSFRSRALWNLWWKPSISALLEGLQNTQSVRTNTRHKWTKEKR